MTARYAVFDTLTDRDVREFDDLPGAYAEIDRLKRRHGTRFAVRPAQERRERVRTAKVLDLLPTPDAVLIDRKATNPAQFGEPIGRGTAFQILEAVKHLTAAIEQLGQDISEIKATLQKRDGGRPSDAVSRLSSAIEVFPEPPPRRTAEMLDASVARLRKATLSASVDERSPPADRRAPNGSRSALLTQLHELLYDMEPDIDGADTATDDEPY